MTGSLDLSPAHQAIVERILAEHVPDSEVRAFGSRVTWTARDYSDLDLAVADKEVLPKETFARLQEAFEESLLPMHVDVLDWHSISEEFRKAIDRDFVIVQRRTDQAAAGEWRRVAIGEAIDFAIGGGWGKDTAFPDSVKVSVIRGTDFKRIADGDYASIPRRYEKASSVERRTLKPGDVILEISGGSRTSNQSTGRSFLVSERHLNELGNRVIPDSFCRLLRFDEHQVDPVFAYYSLQDMYLSGRAASYEQQSTGISNFQFSYFRDSEIINLPSLAEQRAIAHILGTLDDKIDLNRRMNQTLEEMARGLFKSWFVDFDPVRAKIALKQHAHRNHATLEAESSSKGTTPGAEWTVERARAYLDAMDPRIVDLFPERLLPSELGEIPEGWEVAELGSVAHQRRDGLSSTQFHPSTAYIGLEHMPKRCIALQEWDSADGLVSTKFRFMKGDILFGKLRPYFHKVGVAPLDGVCSTDIVVISPASPDWFGFVLGHASSSEFVDYTDSTSTGTRMPRTKWADMARFKIPLPNQDLASAFESLVHPWINGIVSAIHQSHSLAVQRDTLLPGLVSEGAGTIGHGSNGNESTK